MNKGLKILTIILIFLTLSGFGPKRTDFRKGINKNVCKSFTGDVLVYLIFIDSKATKPWTEFDINTTLDSLAIAIKWLQEQATKEGKSIKIKSDYYIGEYATINKSLPEGSVRKSLSEPNLKTGIKELNNWADYISKKAGSTINIIEKDGIPEVENPRNKERLIAHLRDENNVESVALLLMVNNYFKDDVSIALNTLGTEEIEFAIVSYKYPAEIAHNILHLYGAADLYKTEMRQNQKRISMAKKYFPNDIMQEPYGMEINSREIGDFTKYLIGWKNELDTKYNNLLIDNAFDF